MGFLPLAFLPFSEQIQKLPIPAMKRIHKGFEELDELIYGMIAQRRAGPADRGDLLSMLMAAVDTDAARGESTTMSDTQLHDEWRDRAAGRSRDDGECAELCAVAAGEAS